MATDIATDVVKFHLSLNSSNLPQSIAFYRVLFNAEPAKVRDDYAKFEVDEPPLIMSLVPVAPTSGGTLNHVGLRVCDSATLVAMQARLEQAGYGTQREEGVECCYSKQTKFWVADPDRTLWELYVLHGEVDEHDEQSASAQHGVGGNSTLRTQGLQLPVLNATAAAPEVKPRERVVYAHLLTQPLPERIDHADGTVDDVQLLGTFNLAQDRARLASLLQEVHRVLRPGSGTVSAHVLTSAGGVVERPTLPGPAALVERVLPTGDVVNLLCEAGFVSARITKLAAKPCFTVDGVELRETKLEATSPDARGCAGSMTTIIYRGPLAALQDDFGTQYHRGVPTQVSGAAWSFLQAAGMAEQFTCLTAAMPTTGGCCG